VSALTVLKSKPAAGNGAGRLRDWLSPLNLHWAGVGLLALVNLYLLVQMALLWHGASNYNADAVAQQRIQLKTAEISAAPLRGLDEKLARATADADKFYRDRLAGADSEVYAEIGALAKKQGVRYTRGQYGYAMVLSGSKGELTEMRVDASLTGDYRPLMLFLNSLERDKIFFVINGVTLTGQQSGTVTLRLRLTTYLRENAPHEPAPAEVASGEGALATPVAASMGGSR
jgi:type IV pilus assembly protein PilO